MYWIYDKPNNMPYVDELKYILPTDLAKIVDTFLVRHDWTVGYDFVVSTSSTYTRWVDDGSPTYVRPLVTAINNIESPTWYYDA